MEAELLDSGVFSSLDLDDRLQRALSKLNYKNPTLIQSTAIPLALQGKDILARARTGSGKTAAYCLPIIQKILASKENDQKSAIRALILVPTKELAEQVCKEVSKFCMYCTSVVRCINISDGDQSMANQRPILAEKPDIIISTPSKILAHLNAENLVLKDSIESLVIDEADLILSYGYNDDMKVILSFLPSVYQSYLMSATMSPDIDQLKQLVLRNPAVLKLEESREQNMLTQYVVHCSEADKFLLTFFILKLRLHPFGSGKCIIFVNSVERCYRLKLFLDQFGIKCCTLNSELPLQSRFHIVQEFNRGIYDYIIATDDSDQLKSKEVDSDDETVISENPKKKSKKDSEYGVSRGIDFKNVQAVVNFDIPKSSRSYMHRVGRTARGVGNLGFALTFLSPNEIILPKSKNDADSPRQETVFKRIEKKQAALGRTITNFSFNMNQVEGFRYRIEDGLRAVTGVSIKEARIKDIKAEILNSEKLKVHFEENPKDLHALRHDQAIHPSRIQSHMKHVPDYLMPNKGSEESAYSGFVPFKSMKKGGKRKGSLSATQAVSGSNDIEASVAHLTRHHWNIEAALFEFLDSGFQPKAQEPNAPSAPAPVRPTQPSAVSLYTYGIFDLFILPLKLTFRFIFSILSFTYKRFFKPPVSVNGTSPEANAAQFKLTFESKYGTTHPAFYQGSYSNALETAKRNARWMLAILYAPDHDDTDFFCKEILCSRRFINFLNSKNAIVWAGDVRCSEACQVSELLSVSEHPFMAFIAPQGSRMIIFNRFQGVLSLDVVLTKLNSESDKYLASVTAARRERTARESTRTIRDEQDDAYQASLKADQEKERLMLAEKEKILLQKEQEEKEKMIKLTKIQIKENRKIAIMKSLKEEPNSTEPNLTKLSLRLPSGERIIRRFKESDNIQLVYDFIETRDLQPLPIESDFVLVNTYPRILYLDYDKSLLEAGLCPNASLIVEEKLE